MPRSIERDVELLIDTQLRNLGWDCDPQSGSRNVYQQRAMTDRQRTKLRGKRPDYILYRSDSSDPLAVIEAKRPGRKIHDALDQGAGYASAIDAPLVFATDGVFTKTLHLKANRPLLLNGEEIDELIRETLALRFLVSNEIDTLDKRVVRSRRELVSIFETVNKILREEGLQQGLERFSEFANILFLKVLSEVEDAREEQGLGATIPTEFRWDAFKGKRGEELLGYVSNVVLRSFAERYQDDNIFQPLQIRHPDNLRTIIDLLDGLQLTDINADIKGDAFEYFIRSYSASNPSDLGEIFTPRHIVKTMVRLLKPEIGETIYDPFCGTGGMLIVAFKHLMDTMPRNEQNLRTLQQSTVYGADLTKSASIAKMNMILAGDGHNNIVRRDSLANPVDKGYDIVLTNMPFAQKTRYGDKYPIPSRNGDIVCPQHCFRALRDGGRMAIIVPDGFLTNTNDRSYEQVRQYLLDRAKLESVVSLPRGAFEPYNRVKASILYFTGARRQKTTKHYWYFDVRNDGYTLDRKRHRIDGPNDLELVLSENALERQAEEYLATIGITRIDTRSVRENRYILSAAHYREAAGAAKYPTTTLGEILAPSGSDRVGDESDTPIMSITMAQGLIDQEKKFKKRVASRNISKYRKVYKGELVVGFPIDEGVLGIQFKYPAAAVSPAYAVWRPKTKKVHLRFLDLLLRSPAMRRIYREKMQGAVDRRRSIPPRVFLEIEVPIPPMAIQKRVVARYEATERAASKLEEMRQEIQGSLNNLWED